LEQNISQRAQDLSENGYYFNKLFYFQKAWELIRPNWVIMAAFTGIYVALVVLLLRFPQVGQIIQMVISGPISAGYYLSMYRLMKGQAISFENFLEGFKVFIPAMMIYMITGLLASIGLILLVVPGLIIFIIYLFAMPMMIFGGLEFWPAMESSRVVIMTRFWDATIFIALIVALNFIGALLFGFGLLITIPITYAAILVAFEDIYGFDQEEQKPTDFSHFR
jgi:uncharacterized membrane protein